MVGGGLAGVEAAWAAASQGCPVRLIEMRPGRMTAAHRSGNLAEIVCSNSLKSEMLTNAAGVLKREMRRLGSLILEEAEGARVPAGEALAVDPDLFARAVTARIAGRPLIRVERAEVVAIPDDRPAILCTGPLTSSALAEDIVRQTGVDSLAFHDAVAPTVTLESIDLSVAYRGSRRGRDTSDDPDTPGDYINCPLDRDEYEALYREIRSAEVTPLEGPDADDPPYFEGCLPIEELARRGWRTLAFGPMKPIGLRDPRTGRGAFAVVQLRQESREGTLWGLVGFQSRMRWTEQRRIFRMIPGLARAEFVRYGVMHRNSYVCAPRVLEPTLEVKGHPGLFIAGQLAGVEGYVESAAMGMLAGINAARILRGLEPVVPPRATILGSLCAYLTETMVKRFAPMNANFGIVPELAHPPQDKREKARIKADIAITAIEPFALEIERPQGRRED